MFRKLYSLSEFQQYFFISKASIIIMAVEQALTLITIMREVVQAPSKHILSQLQISMEAFNLIYFFQKLQ
jgi:hypothetical protein